jgi:hypothetical protein
MAPCFFRLEILACISLSARFCRSSASFISLRSSFLCFLASRFWYAVPILTMNAGSDTQVQVMTVSAGGDAAKGAAATLRGQQHCEVTSPSHCQPRLNVESQWFDQGTALSCGVSYVGLDCRKDRGRIGFLGDSLWGITCSSYKGLCESDYRKEGAWGRYLLFRRCLLVWRHLLACRHLRKWRYLSKCRYLHPYY